MGLLDVDEFQLRAGPSRLQKCDKVSDIWVKQFATLYIEVEIKARVCDELFRNRLDIE